MPGVRLEDLLAAAELDDTPENRTLAEEVLRENDADPAPQFNTDIASMQQPGAPVQPMKTPRPAQLLGDKSFGVSSDFEVDSDKLRLPPTSPHDALARAGTRFAVGAIEGTVKPFLQVLGEVSETVQREFPGGHLGLGDELERANLLGEATHAERFAEKVGEGAGFFAPISGVGRAVRAGFAIKPWAKFLIEPALVSMAAVLDGRSQTDRSLREGDWRPTADDWKTFGTSVALLPAGALVGVGVVKGVNRLLKTPLSEEVKHLVSNSAVGAAFGAYSGHQGKLGRDELIEEVLAGALSFAIGGQVARVFAGDLRPNTQRQADRAVELTTGAIEKHAEGPAKSKFEALVEEQSAVESYGLRKHAAEIFWTNSAAKEGERPTFEQVKTAFRLTDADARKVVTTKVPGAEIAEAKENMARQAELEAAHANGPEALQAKLIELGIMPEAERKIIESRAPGAAKPGTIESEVASDLRRPEGTTPLFDAKGKIIPPAKQATDRFVGSGVDVPSSEATARLEGIQPARPTLVTPVERVGQPRSLAPAPIPTPAPPRNYPVVRVGTDPMPPPVTVRTPVQPGPSRFPAPETPQTEIARLRAGLKRKPKGPSSTPARYPVPQERALVRVGTEPVLPAPSVRVPVKPGPSSFPPPETPEPTIRRLRREPYSKVPKVRVGKKKTGGTGATPVAASAGISTPPPVTGRQEVAPGKIPPPSQAPAAPVSPASEAQQAAQRLRDIRAKLGVKGLPPEERAALQAERREILGGDLPFDSDFSKQAKVRDVMGQKPRTKPSPTEVEAQATVRNPKAQPKEKQVASAAIKGGQEADKATEILHASKPPKAPAGDTTLNVGLDPTVAFEWMRTAAKRLPKVNPPGYEAQNNKRPGPRAAERWVAEIEDLFHGRPESYEARNKEVKALLDGFRAQAPQAAGKAAAIKPVDDFTGRFILPSIDYIRQHGPAGEKIADGAMRVWRRLLTRENEVLLDLGEKQMEWGVHKRGKVKNWLNELSEKDADSYHEWVDAYGSGKRGGDLPPLASDGARLMAAAWEKARFGAQTVPLSRQEAKIVEGFTEWLRGTYGWFHGAAVDAGLATKAYVSSAPGGQYLPSKLHPRTFVPIKGESWIENKIAWVRTDQGIMTKAEWTKRAARAEKIQDEIVRQMTAKLDKNGKPLHTETEVRERLREYQDKYHDPYAQKFPEHFDQGVNQPETNLTLHRYFDVTVGVEADLGKLLKSYMRSNLLAIEMAKEWGPQRERARAMIEVAGLQGMQRKSLAEALDVAMMQDPKKNRMSGEIMSEVRGWAMFSKLGKTVLLQIPQDVTISAYTGFGAYAKGIPKTLRSRIYTDPNLPISIRKRLGDKLSAKYISQTGALVESELHTAIEQLHGWGPKAAAFMLSKTGMRMLDQFNRGHAGISGRIYGEKVLNEYRYANSPKAKAHAEAKIREMFQDPKDVESAISGRWVKDAAELDRLVAMVGEAVAYRSQFRTLPIDMPLARTDSAFRSMYDLKGYSVRATREMFRAFNLRNPSSPLRNRATALRWLSGMAASATVSGWFVNRLREALLGEDPESDPWFVRVRDSLVSVGFFPIFKDLWETAKGAHGNKNPAMLVLGPSAEYAGEQVKAGAQAISQRSTKPLFRQAAKNIPKTPYERVIGPTIREPLQERGATSSGGRRRVRVRVRRRQPASAN